MKLKALSLLLCAVCILSCCSCDKKEQTALDNNHKTQVQQTQTITNELREKFFDVAVEYSFDRLPYLKDGNQPFFWELQNYTVNIMNRKYCHPQDPTDASETTPFVYSHDVKNIAKTYFDVEYDLPEREGDTPNE